MQKPKYFPYVYVYVHKVFEGNKYDKIYEVLSTLKKI